MRAGTVHAIANGDAHGQLQTEARRQNSACTGKVRPLRWHTTCMCGGKRQPPTGFGTCLRKGKRKRCTAFMFYPL